MADLVAVVSGNRKLLDAKTRAEELDNDFGIEMKIVGILVKRDAGQRPYRIDPVTGMEFREAGPEKTILDSRQNLIAHPFIQRHSAVTRGAGGHHAGSKHGIGLAGKQRLEQIR